MNLPQIQMRKVYSRNNANYDDIIKDIIHVINAGGIETTVIDIVTIHI